MYNNEFSQEFEQAFGQELEAGGPSMENFEFNPEYLGETNGETQGESYEMNGEYGNELNETLEMEMAHELLEVSNEEELNQFLGKLIKGAGRAIGGFAKSSVGRTIGGALKAVAKKALPLAGGALGTFFGGPLGAAVGSKLGSMAGNLFELELEGLSPEDQEFETARAYVRFANSAASRAAALHGQRRGTPSGVVRQALTGAARPHAPGPLRPRNANGTFRARGQRPRRPGGFGPQRPGRPPYVPGGYPSTGYPQSDGGYDQPDADTDDDSGSPTRGTWVRQGRTLVIQL